MIRRFFWKRDRWREKCKLYGLQQDNICKLFYKTIQWNHLLPVIRNIFSIFFRHYGKSLVKCLLVSVSLKTTSNNNCWLFVGNKPPQVHPDKRFYLPIDVRRMAKHYGLPMNDHEGEVCNVTYWSCPMRKTPRFNMEHFLGEFPYTDTQFSQCQFF